MKVFKEEQRFTQTWLIILIAMSILVPIGIIINEFNKEETNMSFNEMVLIIVSMIVCIVPIFFFKLTTKIDELGIHYQFFPFHFSMKTFSWKEIKTATVRTYDPIGEFGGWGFKGGFFWKKSKGKAISVSGDIGIQLEFKNRKKLLIGTQKENETKQVLATYKNNYYD